ncbi:MAG: T9SS type A sorting domain-containing protein [Bacteroidia bacterium]
MKKIYTLIATVAVVLSANAQSRSTAGLPHTAGNPTLQINSSRAAGDTIFWFDGNSFMGSGISSTSTPPFAFANDDVDALAANAAMTPWTGTAGSNWQFFYDLNSVTSDTNFFMGATSWFTTTPATPSTNTSDDWFAVGPIAIPAAGATLSWKHNMPDGNYRDGYKVYVSTTGESNYTDFTSAPIYTVVDNQTTPPSTAGDTVNSPDNVFALRSTSLMAYAGQNIFIGWQHQAYDQFILYLDDLVVTEGPASVSEYVNGAKLFQNTPNPTNGTSVINYELEKNAQVALNVYDVTGKLIVKQNMGDQTSGTHNVKLATDNLSAGVYYYSLTVNNATTAAMKMVVIK